MHEESIVERAVRELGVDAMLALARGMGVPEDELRFDWSIWGRPSQFAPPDDEYSTLVYLSGRGGGKTRSAVEIVRERIERGLARKVGLVARTAADARDTMVKGVSGFLEKCPPWNRPLYEPSKRLLTWQNGATALLFSADEPDQLRGPGFDLIWCDELAHWKRLAETWANVEMVLREGRDPKLLITTTPLPLELLKQIIAEPGTVTRRWSTFDNASNLARVFLDKMRRKYAGTRLGRQELEGEILEDVLGALWTRALIEHGRISDEAFDIQSLDYVAVAVDPATADDQVEALLVEAGGKGGKKARTTKDRNEAGIVVTGRQGDAFFVLDDRSVNAGPDAWARVVLETYRDWRADEIVVESNAGHGLLTSLLRGAHRAETDARARMDSPLGSLAAPRVRLVNAARGKRARAEPVVALFEQGCVHFVGSFPKLEDQLCSWVPGDDSPDRLDALVWGITALDERTVSRTPAAEFKPIARTAPPLPEGPAEATAAAEAARFRKWMAG